MGVPEPDGRSVAEPIRIGDLLGALPGMTERLAEARLLQSWPGIAGAAAAPRSRAERVEGGVLHVAVESSGWLHRLGLEEAALLTRCQAIAEVRAIRFHLAPRVAVAVSPEAPGGERPPQTPGTPEAMHAPVRPQGEVP